MLELDSTLADARAVLLETSLAILADPARPADTLRYHELQGFLFAVASAPELILPSEWQPIIFVDQEVVYASLDEAEEILGQITALYNAINAAVLDAPTLLPGDCQLRDDVLANFEDAAPIASGPAASCVATSGWRHSGRNTSRRNWPRS